MLEPANQDIIFILISTFVAALLGFLIGWFLNNMKSYYLKNSLDTCYKENEQLKKRLKKTSDSL